MSDRDQLLWSLTSSIQPARRAWISAATTVLSQYGLSMSLGSTLLLLRRDGGVAQQKLLAEEIGINAAAMVRVLDQGEEAGLLKRVDAEGNRRNKNVELSAKGRRLSEKLEQAIQALRRAVLGHIAPGDIEIAVKVMRQLETSAKAYCAQEKSE